jgi:hypothetical protein
MGLKRKRITWSLVGHWFSDDSDPTIAYDHSGNLNHGTIYGALWTQSKVGRALSFDGVDDYVYIGPITNLRINHLGNNVTICAWVYWKGHPDSLARIGGFSGYSGDYALWVNYQGKILFEVDGQHGNILLTATAVISQNVWNFVVGTFNQDKMKIYVNDNMVASATPSYFPPAEGTTNLNIGNKEAYYFYGFIDEFKIFKTVLSDDEIKDLYAIGRLRNAI